LAASGEAGHGRLRDRVLSVGRELAADFHQLELFTYANAIAFCVLFSLVPFALFVVALLGFLDLTVLWTRDVAPGVGAIVGPSAFGVLDETVRQILATRQGYWLTAGLALTVWELSNAVFAVAGALNRVYRLSEERPLWGQLGRSIVLGVVVGICLLATLAVTQVVPGLAERALGPGPLASVLGFIARWVVAVAAMLLVVGVLIRYAPAEPVRWRWVGTGTLVTVGGWTLTSIGFGAYIGGLVNYGSLFGGLALPFVLLLYLYVAALALLLGVWVERRQRLGVDRPAVGEGAEASRTSRLEAPS
jgi:membrane protein